MSKHVINISDEEVLDYICTIDGDVDNDILIQRVMDGHFLEWEKIYKEKKDREFMNKFIQVDEETKTNVISILDSAIRIKVEQKELGSVEKIKSIR